MASGDFGFSAGVVAGDALAVADAGGGDGLVLASGTADVVAGGVSAAALFSDLDGAAAAAFAADSAPGTCRPSTAHAEADATPMHAAIAHRIGLSLSCIEPRLNLHS